MPKKKPETRQEACMILADWDLSKPEHQYF
jgi:hypothetical protein